MKRHLVIGAMLATAMSTSANAAYVFGSSSPNTGWTLTINGVDYQSIDTGWIGIEGQHSSDNSNYIVGDCCGSTYNNWGVFDLSNVTGVITSAVLSLNSYSVSGSNVLFSLFDVDASLADLDTTRPSGDATGQALYLDLGSGSFYGDRVYNGSDINQVRSISLNANALSDIAASAGGQFAIGGTLQPGQAPSVPEPGTWLMLLLGFFGMGGVLRHRRPTQTTVTYS